MVRWSWGLVVCAALGCSDNVGVVIPCERAEQCPDGQACRNGRCVGCERDDQCPPPATCGGGGVLQQCGCPDKDGDGHRCDDCDDDNRLVFGGATEICDGKDNDCDGEIDEDVPKRFYADADHDQHGNPEAAVEDCNPPAGFVALGDDCNDDDPTVHPGRNELCDHKDNDCDDEIDEGVRAEFYRDADADGAGDADNAVDGCTLPFGYVETAGDCDDSRPEVHPGALEACNARDDDCDGVVDGHARICDNACGPGFETCVMGAFGGCTAPPITTITKAMRVGASSFACLSVKAALGIDADVTVETANWVRVETNGSIEMGPRALLSATGNLELLGTGSMTVADGTLRSAATVSLGPDARIFVQGIAGRAYSGPGASACTDGGTGGVSGGGGGARGGDGGKGGSCGVLVTQPTPGAGGVAAAAGATGCDCNCSANAAGGAPSGGEGGAAMSGGGGGGNGGKGGDGVGGAISATLYGGGEGGSPEPSPTPTPAPTVGGGGGGGGGAAFTSFAPEACTRTGGAGGGILRIVAAGFFNEGVVLADGLPGRHDERSFVSGGGGGGGAGGTLVFRLGSFENRGSLSARGGAGANGQTGNPANCSAGPAGGGGGGGGGQIFVDGPMGGGAPTVVMRGNLFVNGGSGGASTCGLPSAQAGAPGVVIVP